MLSAYLADRCVKRNIIPYEKREICRVGFDLIISEIITSGIILGIGILTHSVLYGIIYLLMLRYVRRFSGGFHAKTYWLCCCITIGIYLAILGLTYVIQSNYMVYAAIFDTIAIVTMIMFAPIKHPNKDLTERETKANKLFALITTSFCSAVSMILVICSRKEGLVISLVLLAISILMYVGLLVNRKEGYSW